MVSVISRLWRRIFAGSTFRPLTPYGLPGPVVPHLQLKEAELRDKRLFVIGDVHGCHDELALLLEKADATRADVQVIFVGDLVNKGPKNVECVELARRIGALCVRGNHDDVALSVLRNSRAAPGLLPAQSEWVAELSAESEQWLLDLPYSIHLPWLDVIVVHAGLVPGIPLSQQLPEDMMHMRNVTRDEVTGAYVASRKSTEGSAWASVWNGPPHVYFGHDARRKLQLERHATGLDTGCVYGGSLSGLYLDDESRRIYSVPAQATYRKP